jgi:hypothetical protein
MGPVRFAETLVITYKTAWFKNRENRKIAHHCRKASSPIQKKPCSLFLMSSVSPALSSLSMQLNKEMIFLFQKA